MSTEQKLHLVAITFFVVAAILFTTSWITATWNGLWVLSILALVAAVTVESWTEVHYGREAWTAAHEDDDA
jgi:hypothetical protein